MLSDKDKYPLVRVSVTMQLPSSCAIVRYVFFWGGGGLQFARTVGPETSKGPALLGLLKQYNWNKAVIITSTLDPWFESGLQLTQQLRAASITVHRPSAFEPRQFRAAALHDIQRSGIRIIFLMAWPSDVKEVFTHAQIEAMTTTGWAWIEPQANGLNKTQGWLYMQQSLNSEKMLLFVQQVSNYSETFDINILPNSVDLTYSAALYDAIMLYAHAATRVLSEGGELRDGKAVITAVRSTTFEGVGDQVGAVALDRNTGDRIETYMVVNYVQGADGGMSSVPVGVYDARARQYKTYERAVVWPGADIYLHDELVCCNLVGLRGRKHNPSAT